MTWQTDLDLLASDCLKRPKKLKPSEWAERNRILTAGVSAEPGPWHNSRTPYLAGLMDAVVEPGVEEITFVKPTQVGGSEALRNILGYWIDEDPGPCLFVMPSEQAVKETLEERIKPLLFSTPSLRRHVSSDPHDLTQTAVKLDSMTIYFGWAGSPQSLASRPCRYVVFDEVDKYPPFAGREADPISLGIERTATYGHRRKILKISTPTTRDGAIWKAWEASGQKRRFEVPCPKCGEFQLWSFQQIRWSKQPGTDRKLWADTIEQQKLAYYECRKCGEHLTDSQKPKMLLAGRWAAEGGDSKKIGLHYNAVGSPWRSFSETAGTFIRADGDPGATMNFRNSWLAEPFEDQISKVQPGMIREKAQLAPPAGVVPKWTQALFSLVDTQKDWFKVHVRAWGWGYRSQLVYEGICQSFEEVQRVGLQSQFNVDGGGLATPSHQLIDSGGSRTDEVYQYALSDPGRIIPTKGASHQMRRPYSLTRLPSGLTLIVFDTAFYKDMLTRLIQDPDPTKWLPHRDVTDQYCLEMAAEHKILDRKANRMLWVPVSAGVRNEAWDCEVLACVAADMANIGAMPAEPAQASATASTNETHANPLNYRGRW